MLIDSSMAIYNDNSVDKSVADTAVEELEPTIQNLELEQKFNDAESYLIESGEINGDGTGTIRILLINIGLDLLTDFVFQASIVRFPGMYLFLYWATRSKAQKRHRFKICPFATNGLIIR